MYLFRNLKLAPVWTILTVGLGLLLVFNTRIYFQSGLQAAFLIEKGATAGLRIWQGAFYLHIVSSCVVLLSGFGLFFQWVLRNRWLHASLGYVYVNSVLWMAAPSGLILAPWSKGGWPAALGFALTGIIWWYATWRGYRCIRQGDIRNHIQWMVRSWCLALSAVSFRIIHIALFYAGIHPLTNYVLSIWLSLFANALFAEWFIYRNFHRVSESAPSSKQLIVS